MKAKRHHGKKKKPFYIRKLNNNPLRINQRIMNEKTKKQAYEAAKAQYATLGVNVDQAIETLNSVPISIHCWQADDVSGFENPSGELTGGIQTTGNYPGKARNIGELRPTWRRC